MESNTDSPVRSPSVTSVAELGSGTRGGAQPPPAINDSFTAFTMENTPILATTRPYDTRHNSAIEKFLTEGNPNGSRGGTGGVSNWSLASLPRGADLHATDNTGMASPVTQSTMTGGTGVTVPPPLVSSLTSGNIHTSGGPLDIPHRADWGDGTQMSLPLSLQQRQNSTSMPLPSSLLSRHADPNRSSVVASTSPFFVSSQSGDSAPPALSVVNSSFVGASVPVGSFAETATPGSPPLRQVAWATRGNQKNAGAQKSSAAVAPPASAQKSYAGTVGSVSSLSSQRSPHDGELQVAEQRQILSPQQQRQALTASSSSGVATAASAAPAPQAVSPRHHPFQHSHNSVHQVPQTNPVLAPSPVNTSATRAFFPSVSASGSVGAAGSDHSSTSFCSGQNSAVFNDFNSSGGAYRASISSPSAAFPQLATRRSEADLRSLLFTSHGKSGEINSCNSGRNYGGSRSLTGVGASRPGYGFTSIPSGSSITAGGSRHPGYGTGSVMSRRRVPTIRATEDAFVNTAAGSISTSRSGGSANPNQRPEWLSAVERVKRESAADGLGTYATTLPIDQSRLGLQSRQVARQGALTVQQLRAYEAREGFEPGAANYAGQQQQQQQQPLYAAAGRRQSSLAAHDETVQYSTHHHLQGGSGSTSSNQWQQLWERQQQQQQPWHSSGISEQSYGRRRRVHTGGRSSVTTSPVGTPSPQRSLSPGHCPAAMNSTSGVFNTSGSSPPKLFIASEHQHSGNYTLPHTMVATATSGNGGGSNSSHKSFEERVSNFFAHSASSAPMLPSLFAAGKSSSPAASVQGGGSTGNRTGQRGMPSGGVLVATDEGANVAQAVGAGGDGGGGRDGGSGGGGNDNNGNNNNNGNGGGSRRPRRDAAEDPKKSSKAVKENLIAAGDGDDHEERTFRSRNINALHAIPWEQRRAMPMTGFGTRFFALLSSPRFWEKLDWAFRGSILTVLPTMVLSIEPSTSKHFPMPSMLAFNAFWITMPTFGSGMREFYIALKGFCVGLIYLLVMIAIQPGPDWLVIFLIFIITLVNSFIAEEIKKTTAYVIASTFMAYLTDHTTTEYKYVGDYYISLLIALAFAMVGFLFPFIRWSSCNARHYISALGNVVSINVQGTCSSFWVRSPLERELNVVRLRQLRATAAKCIEKIDVSMDESEYEPHTGRYMAKMQVRYKFCKNMNNILGSLNQVIELLAESPELIDTPMCTEFGARIEEPLAVLASAMDSMILKIVDFHRTVTPQDIMFFREARDRFQDALSQVREEVILTNENYETDESDVFLGFFMFSVDELSEVICNFAEVEHPRNNLIHALLFPLRDLQSTYNAFRQLFYAVVHRHTITRRLKEAIKLTLCMTIPCVFQVFALGNEATSPMAGAAIIALVYNPTGSESFHYASGRLMGTVIGSTAALLCVQVANGRRWVLYILMVILSFIGAYVQAAPGFYALGNAIVCSTISIMVQYQNQSAAMVRIQQNCFAILIYFAIVSIVWPMQARDKVKMSLDSSLRCFRESTARLLRNLDMPDDAEEVTADVAALLKEMDTKINAQSRFIPGAVEEPTMGSVEYPEDAWKKIVLAERKVHSTLSMMRFAYHVFMSSKPDNAMDVSVHWVVLHRISSYTKDLSDLIYAVIDLYLLTLSRSTEVPPTHLTRLRQGMIESQKAILDTYMQTIQLKIDGEVEDGEDEGGEEEEDDYDGDDYMMDGYDGDRYQDGSNRSVPPPTTTSRRPDIDNKGNTTTTTTNNNNNNNNNSNSNNSDGKNSGNKDENDDNSDKDGDDADGKQRKRKKTVTINNASMANPDAAAATGHKKKGYMTYDLTPEEEEQLRNFIAGRPVGNNTFTGTLNGTLNGNASRLMNASMCAPAACDNDDRLMALAGTDDDLAARLRKKHKVTTSKEVAEAAEAAEAKKNAHHHTATGEPTATTTATMDNPVENNNSFAENHSFIKNSSFMNNSFLKNRSIFAGLFKRKSHVVHDLDDEDDHMYSNGSDEDENNTSRRRKSEARSDGATTRNASRPDSPRYLNSKNSTAAAAKSIPGKTAAAAAGPPRAKRSTRGVSMATTAPTIGQESAVVPPALASSTPLDASTMPLSGALRKTAVASPTLEGTRSRSMAVDDGSIDQSSRRSSSSSDLAQELELDNSSIFSEPSPRNHEHADGLGNTSSKKTKDTSAVHEVEMDEQHHDVWPTAIAIIAAATPAEPATVAAKKPSGSNNSSAAHSGTTEKRVVSDVPSSNSEHTPDTEVQKTTATAAEREGGGGGGGNTDVKRIITGSGSGSGRHDESQDCDSSSNSSNNYNVASLQPSMSRHAYASQRGGGPSSSDAGSRLGNSSGALRNVSFFDADHGEFILTNHDIHSLEAYLFGTRALVACINELQNALLEMQHATELSKKL